MNTASYLLDLMARLAAHPALAYFLELALKSSALLLFTMLAATALRRSTAASKHLWWCLCILTLGCLPVLLGIMPDLAVSLADSARLDPAASAAPVLTDAAAPARGDLLTATRAWWQAALKVYIAGLLLLVCYTLSGLIGMLLLSRQAVPSTNGLAQRLLDTILAEELADTSVALREHPALRSPLSWGLLRPVIILPAASGAWPASRLRHVLLHELGHIQRMDWITRLMARYACAVYWYNPLVWYAARRMDEAAEQACDDAVLLGNGNHTDYASDLVAVAKATQPSLAGSYLASALATSFLGSRITAILDPARRRGRNDSVWVIRAVLCAFSLGAVLAALTVGPATGLASLGSSFSRYIDVNFLPARAAAESEAMIVHLPPERLYLSSNLPELETIRVTNSPVTGKTPGAPLRLPDITLQELPGATPSQALQLLRKSFPAYPPAAELRGIEGQVTIEYAIDAMGQVVDPVIIESGPGTVFNRSALQAIRKYRYEPPRVNGKPTGMRGLRTRFVFALDPDPG